MWIAPYRLLVLKLGTKLFPPLIFVVSSRLEKALPRAALCIVALASFETILLAKKVKLTLKLHRGLIAQVVARDLDVLCDRA